MPIPAQYSEVAYSPGSTKHWDRNPSPDKGKPSTALLTTAGDTTFSERLKVWLYWTDEQPQNNRESKPQILPVDLSWIHRVAEPASGPLKPADIMPAIAGLTQLLEANRFEEVDRLLKSVKVSHAAPEIMVALLRITYPVRGKRLRHWSKLLRDVRAELSARHLDSERILRGLA